jgi:hypothetical protein
VAVVLDDNRLWPVLIRFARPMAIMFSILFPSLLCEQLYVSCICTMQLKYFKHEEYCMSKTKVASALAMYRHSENSCQVDSQDLERNET